MKNYDAKKALTVILKAAKEYDEKLNDNIFCLSIARKMRSVRVVLDSGI